MSSNVRFRGLLLVLLCVNLAACGFRLAQTAAVSKSISSIHLVTQNFTDSQRARLVDRLQNAGAILANGASNRLTVSLQKIPDRTLVNSAESGKSVERLTRQLRYSIRTADGEVLVEPTTLVQRRDITLDDDNLHSSNRERREIIEDLEVALFNQLVHSLQRL